MTRTRAEINAIKIKFLDFLEKEPAITNAELCRRCGITQPTAARYRQQLMNTLTSVNTELAKEIIYKTDTGGSIWLMIKRALKIK